MHKIYDASIFVNSLISCHCKPVQWRPCCVLGIPSLGQNDQLATDEQHGHWKLWEGEGKSVCILCTVYNEWVKETDVKWEREGGRGREKERPTCEYVLWVTWECTVPYPLLWALLKSVPEVKVRRRPNLTSPIGRGCCQEAEQLK